jgi:heptaprenyl diphosphate synthase
VIRVASPKLWYTGQEEHVIDLSVGGGRDMTSVHTEWESIVEEIAQYAENPFVKRCLGRPHVPSFFVQVLYMMLKSHELPISRIRRLCTATALLQMALDIHETVSLDKPKTEEQMRIRQLTVLAGDYYSSQFYRLLSEQGEVDAVACLAQATCRINEAKMRLYALRDDTRTSSSVWLPLIRRIRGELLAALADFFHAENRWGHSWRPLAERLMALDYLVSPRVKETFPWLADDSVPAVLLEEIQSWLEGMKLSEARQEWAEAIQRRFASVLGEPLLREG